VIGQLEIAMEENGVRIGMDASDYRHWLEYDSVVLTVLLVGIGFVELIVLSIEDGRSRAFLFSLEGWKCPSRP